ncbi:hypothetical protein C8K66_101131 [Pseudomonas sp. GV105]|nr:hypothetical protein C8K66_101131 [Pseudomonas sp. GV105]
MLRKLGDGVGHCTRLLGRHGASGVGDCFVFDLPQSGALTPVQSNAANTLRDLARAVAGSWNVRLVDSHPDARLQAPDTDQFSFQARVTDRGGPQTSREVASLGLTALSAGVGPDGQWPQVWALTAAGSILVQRNQKLLGADGPSTNPAFVFQTDRAGATLTPLRG